MSLTPLESQTREIFHELHKAQGQDDAIFRRLTALLTPAYLNEPDDFFRGKICLDAGCGSNANATHSMLTHLSTDNVLHLSFPDNMFDFAHCSGVLHHAADVFTGLKELARVTKPGGILYIMTYGKGGLIRDIVTCLRQKYQQDAAFKQFVDHLDAGFFIDLLQHLAAGMLAHGDAYGAKLSQELIHELVDADLVLTIKDRITAPLYQEHSEAELTAALRELGLTRIERLTRYPQFTNIRRFLSPLYFRYDSDFARLFYGDGSVQLKAMKGAMR